ncbi:MAG: 50S ribosomal protein L20 [Bdellovibrionales bacterium]|nr:50S ribosomal protein L20 [Bdellovibrionales bacterium]
MRVKGGVVTRRRHKKLLKRASGFYAANSRSFTHAREKVDRAQAYEYRDRRTKKREIRALWIQRINAAARLNGTSYSRLMSALKKAGIELDRKVLSNMAIVDASGFSSLVKQVLPQASA